MNFWQNLPKPIFVLAPMADVTDVAFRQMIAKYSAHERKDETIGGPDVTWTEFVSADGLTLAPEEGRKKLLADLAYTEPERPIVAQLFSSNEAHMEAAAALCRELGFDGVDINMGCPDRSIEKQGCGSAMIKNPTVAKAIIRAAKRGAGELPVSVKTRVGYNHEQIDEWIPYLLEETPAVLTVHARTRKEMSKVPADWSRIERIVALRDSLDSETLVIGNGDATSLSDAEDKVRQTGADGVMLGRAIFGNPFLFHPDKDISTEPLSERLRIMVEHTRLFEEELPHKNFAIMKKHYKAYVNGFAGAAELRASLMEQNTAEEIEQVVHDFLTNSSKQ